MFKSTQTKPNERRWKFKWISCRSLLHNEEDIGPRNTAVHITQRQCRFQKAKLCSSKTLKSQIHKSSLPLMVPIQFYNGLQHHLQWRHFPCKARKPPWKCKHPLHTTIKLAQGFTYIVISINSSIYLLCRCFFQWLLRILLFYHQTHQRTISQMMPLRSMTILPSTMSYKKATCSHRLHNIRRINCSRQLLLAVLEKQTIPVKQSTRLFLCLISALKYWSHKLELTFAGLYDNYFDAGTRMWPGTGAEEVVKWYLEQNPRLR